MSVSQGIIVGVVAVISLYGLLTASAADDFRVTLPRFLLASVAPLSWITLTLLIPESWYIASGKNVAFSLWAEIVRLAILFIFGILFIATAPLWLIFPIIVWIQGAMCGELKVTLKEYLSSLRRPHNTKI